MNRHTYFLLKRKNSYVAKNNNKKIKGERAKINVQINLVGKKNPHRKPFDCTHGRPGG